MIRTFNAIESLGWPLVDRAGLMLDELSVSRYDPWTPEGSEGGGGGGDILPPGTLIQDQQGNTWERKGTKGLKLISGTIQGAQFRTIANVVERVGAYFRTQTGRAIELSPTGGFRELTLTETGNLFSGGGGGGGGGRSGGGGGGGGYAPQAFSSTQESQTQAEEAALERQEAGDIAAGIRQAESDAASAGRLADQLEAEADEALKNRDFQKAERLASEAAAARAAELAAKNQLKLARLSEAGALARTFEDIKARARDVIAGMMGKNPFRGAVRARGGIPRGVDPYEKFEAELGGVANMPTPQFSSESRAFFLADSASSVHERLRRKRMLLVSSTLPPPIVVIRPPYARAGEQVNLIPVQPQCADQPLQSPFEQLGQFCWIAKRVRHPVCGTQVPSVHLQHQAAFAQRLHRPPAI